MATQAEMDECMKKKKSRKRIGREWRGHTGMIWCPLRVSSLAVERCGEYQRVNRCGLTCPNRATPEQLTRLAKIRDPTTEKTSDRLTINELVKEGFHSGDRIRDAIGKGELEAESVAVMKDRRRRVWLVSRAAWEKYKFRYTAGETMKDIFTIEQLAHKEGVTRGKIYTAILRGSLVCERKRKVKIAGKRNSIRSVYLISGQAWREYQQSKKRKVFSEAFKQEAVRRINRDKTTSLSAHAEELGISLSFLHKWRRQWKNAPAETF
jgi:hypothetical protein